MPAYDVVLKRVESLRVAQARGVAPSMDQLGPTLDGLFDQVFDHLTQHGASVAGSPITLYPDPEMSDRDINVIACMPFTGELPDGEVVQVVTLPAYETVASVIHHGHFSTLHQAYNAIFSWIEAHGYGINGPNRELNIEYERGGDQSKFVTELQFPVVKQ